MQTISSYCVSCDVHMESQDHHETYRGTCVATQTDIRIPLCDVCLEFPYKMDMNHVVDRVQALKLDDGFYKSSDLLKALIQNKTDRYQNPKPVIIGLIIMELHETGGTLLAGQRSESMYEYPDELALISGYMEEKHGCWRGSLKAEAQEEVAADVDVENVDLVKALTFDHPVSPRLLLLSAVVMPGATSLSDFVPNEETSARKLIDFTKTERPTFGIPQHNTIFQNFCRQQFGW